MKKLFYAVVVQLCMVGLVYAETQQPAQKAFPGTTVLRLDKLMPGNEGGLPVQLAYDSSLSTMLNKTVREEGPIVTTRLLSTRIDRKKEQRFFVDFEPGPSNDPVFLISSENGAKPVGSINADQLILPGDGFVYTAARSNRNYVEHKKFAVRGNKLIEVRQPFLYVGLDSIALRPLTIFSTKEGGDIIASIAKGDRLTVVLGEKNYLLIKTREDLLGWFKLDPALSTRESKAIDGIYFDGD